MSNLPPLSLPRFHVNELSRPRPTKSGGLEHPKPETPFAVEPEDSTPQSEPELEVQAEPETPPVSMLPEIDTGAILNSLEATKAGLERAALAHSQQVVSEFLRAAFPKLSQAFLAEEVRRAIEEMAPKGIERLVLKVPDSYAAAFQRSLQASPEMSEICSLETHVGADSILIDVDWQSGGLTFDMQQFLDSSLARLTGLNQTQEGQNV
ncbi:MAG: hypothetical protein AAFZ74_10530 [Pseudomonadota bacterium]